MACKKATRDILEIRRWANSPEGIAVIKGALQWARDKHKKLERSQRIGPLRLNKPMMR